MEEPKVIVRELKVSVFQGIFLESTWMSTKTAVALECTVSRAAFRGFSKATTIGVIELIIGTKKNQSCKQRKYFQWKELYQHQSQALL